MMTNGQRQLVNFKLVAIVLAAIGVALILISRLLIVPGRKIILWIGLGAVLASLIQVILFNSRPEFFKPKAPDPDEES